LVRRPAATGKTFLLQLLEKRLLEGEQGASVVRISMNRAYTVKSFMHHEQAGRRKGMELSKLKKVKNTWLAAPR